MASAVEHASIFEVAVFDQESLDGEPRFPSGFDQEAHRGPREKRLFVFVAARGPALLR
mgnify:CR=1 FL=1